MLFFALYVHLNTRASALIGHSWRSPPTSFNVLAVIWGSSLPLVHLMQFHVAPENQLNHLQCLETACSLFQALVVVFIWFKFFDNVVNNKASNLRDYFTRTMGPVMRGSAFLELFSCSFTSMSPDSKRPTDAYRSHFTYPFKNVTVGEISIVLTPVTASKDKKQWFDYRSGAVLNYLFVAWDRERFSIPITPHDWIHFRTIKKMYELCDCKPQGNRVRVQWVKQN